MSGLIKAGTVLVSGERRSTLQPPVVEAAPSVLDLQALRIAELEKSLQDATARLSTLGKSAEHREQQAYERGHQEGQEAGQEQAQQRHDEQLQALILGVAKAREAFEQSLVETTRRLSIDLAQAALGRVLGDVSRHGELIAASVGHHLATLSHDSVLAIEVSSADFPSEEALRAAFADAGAMPSQRIVAEAGRAPGSCVIRLKLGRLDLGLESQGHRLGAAFDALRERD